MGNTISKKKKFSDTPIPWLLPLFIVLALMFVYPTVQVLIYGFTNAKITSNNYVFTLNTYKSILSNPSTYYTLWITIIFVFFSVIFQTVLGLAIALAVDKGEALLFKKGSVFVRIASLLSWAIPGVIVGVVWGFIYSETGTGILINIFKCGGI